MSSFLSLIEFTPNEQNKINEQNSKTLLRADINQTLLDDLKNTFNLISTLIPESDDDDCETEFNFLEGDLKKIKKFLKGRILELLDIDKQSLSTNYEKIMSDLHILLNIKELIELKELYNNELVKIKVSM
ncbi:hypothetical protein KWE42_03970 [Acinetobacter pittii]|uniref:Uncharacterized protein n=1 Tax=Acinetobacter pittii TaxID=48296 RepID=A0AAE9M7C7_ACIPI|nr:MULTISPECIES: hypothetical protein [Acinetobacter]AVZ85468.1 hypothetical protein CDG55_06715 [Acinetobacter sp. WCHA45]AZP30181.1 hypothetical protein DLK06_14440 [Acinetobacter pittii]USU93554.1 hypothetical protein MWH18_14500 [Acinetobacter pittii]